MDRREFLELAGLSSISGAVLSSGCMAWMIPRKCISFDFTRHQIETMEALADTVIPYDGAPGAVQAGAWELFKDPFYGVNPWIDEIVSDVDWASKLCFYKKNFKSCDLEDRSIILEDREKFSLYKLVYEGVIAIAKYAYYGGIVNEVGYEYIGFPGQSNGYWPHEDLLHACK